MDKLHEECGIFGIYGHPEAANLTYLGLYALQHRGQESSGIVSSDGESLHSEIAMGLVADVFSQERLGKLRGSIAIGHNRYSTTGSSLLKNAQPFVIDYAGGSLALAHNGNLVNAMALRGELEATGSIFRSTMDSEVIVHLVAHAQKPNLEDRVVDALEQVRGAYSLLIMTRRHFIAVRDPNGFRPLILGRLGGAYVFASETCALDLIGADFVREVEPGEMISMGPEGFKSYRPFPPAPVRQCIFEFIYFARPDSTIFGQSVYAVRKRLGEALAREREIRADIVIPVPDSGVPAALGYAAASGIPYQMGLTRNHYVGRTFIEPQQAIRHFGVKLKLNPIREVLGGKRVIVIDDSIVRGTTSRKIVEMIKNAGAREVHMAISSPPIRSSCFYGIDTPTREELIASSHSVEEIARYLTVDSLTYLSLESLLDAVRDDGENFCTACFTGCYPVESACDLSQLPLFEADW